MERLSEPFWNDINTTITVTNPNDVVIDTAPPVLTINDIQIYQDEQNYWRASVSGNIDDASEILGSGNSFIGINNVKNDGTEKFFNHIIPIQNNDLNENGDFTVSTSIDSFAPGTVQVVHAEIEDVHGNATYITTFGPGSNEQAFSHLPVLEFNRGVSEDDIETDAPILTINDIQIYQDEQNYWMVSVFWKY